MFLEVDGVAGDLGTVHYGRCESCGAVRPDRPFPPITSEHKLLSYYLEQGAAVDLMTAPLMQVQGARRLLEVGCGFGFALDFARVALKLDVLGVDPSRAAEAGAELLGVPVLNTGLDRTLDLGDARFDLVLASEVIEHVDAPNTFLADLRARVSDDAVLRLTTPDADVLVEETPADDLLRALSPGHHTILFTRDALRHALTAAGFPHITWDSVKGTLRCWASPSEQGLRRIRSAASAQQDHTAVLLDYLARRADEVAPGSPLELGFRYRHFKATVNAGLLDRAEDSLRALRRAMSSRHGVELEQPERAVDATVNLSAASGDEIDAWPFCLAGALFFLGILELNGRRRPARAESTFQAAVTIAGNLLAAERPLAIFDGETGDLLVQSALHRVLAIAQQDLARAVDALKTVPVEKLDIARAHLFMTAVHTRDHQRGAELEGHVVSSLEQLGEPSLKASVLRALGLHATEGCRPSDAITWFARGRESATVAGLDDLARTMAAEERTATAVLEDAPVTLARVALPSEPRITHMIDVYWCDAWGMHLKGWLHAHERRVVELRVRLGAEETVVTSFHDRPDLVPFFPEHPHVVHSGFSAYVEGHAGTPVSLLIKTSDVAWIEMPLQLPRGPLPV
jgi:SAM-dependent methyltransferase